MTHLIDHLEKGVNWNKVFGVVDSLYSDKVSPPMLITLPVPLL